jgi:hypothetical protein
MKKVGEVVMDLASHPIEFGNYYGKYANPERTQLYFEKQ